MLSCMGSAWAGSCSHATDYRSIVTKCLKQHHESKSGQSDTAYVCNSSGFAVGVISGKACSARLPRSSSLLTTLVQPAALVNCGVRRWVRGFTLLPGAAIRHPKY